MYELTTYSRLEYYQELTIKLHANNKKEGTLQLEGTNTL
jgi:hypothetical protein